MSDAPIAAVQKRQAQGLQTLRCIRASSCSPPASNSRAKLRIQGKRKQPAVLGIGGFAQSPDLWKNSYTQFVWTMIMLRRTRSYPEFIRSVRINEHHQTKAGTVQNAKNC